METIRKDVFASAKRIVVKVGSNVLTQANGLNLKAVNAISRQICDLADSGREVIFVSSGAMASGIRKLGLEKRPDQIPQRQAIAAVGQAGLIMTYEKAFARHGKKVAQILLTSDDLTNRMRYLNVRNALSALLSWQVIPIINENDTVMVEEIKLGDNDHLSAMITLLLDADLLINLTDIDGLYDKDPRVHGDAELISIIPSINKAVEKTAGEIPGALGTGGMLSKIKAAKKLMAAGIPMVIANGRKKNILMDLFDGQKNGSFFVPKQERLTSRKCWIGFTLKPKGTVVIDEGACAAILNRGKSLLPSGIIRVEGDFSVGAPVAVRKENADVLAVGLVNYNSDDIIKIMGLKTTMIERCLGSKPYDEVIHRDNLTITDTCEI